MTGNEIVKKALTLLSYTDGLGQVSGEQRFRGRAVTVLNTIYSDLFYIENSNGFESLNSLTEEIKLSERALNDVMPYGVAAQFAQSEGDGDNQQHWTNLYNQKRLSLINTDTIKDVLPKVCD